MHFAGSLHSSVQPSNIIIKDNKVTLSSSSTCAQQMQTDSVRWLTEINQLIFRVILQAVIWMIHHVQLRKRSIHHRLILDRSFLHKIPMVCGGCRYQLIWASSKLHDFDVTSSGWRNVRGERHIDEISMDYDYITERKTQLCNKFITFHFTLLSTNVFGIAAFCTLMLWQIHYIINNFSSPFFDDDSTTSSSSQSSRELNHAHKHPPQRFLWWMSLCCESLVWDN